MITTPAKITSVDNLGSPDILVLRAEVRVAILGTPRTFLVSLPITVAEFGDAMWPPQIGDEFPVTFDFGRLHRP